MNNINIGPSSNICYLNGEYGHARIILQRIKLLTQNNEINNFIRKKSKNAREKTYVSTA